MKKLFFAATLWSLILAVTLILAEVLLRVWPGDWNQPRHSIVDPDVGTWNKSNFVSDFRSVDYHVKNIHWNEHGMRDRPRSKTKPVDTFRMGILGDSMMEGLRVTDDLTMTRLLERRLSSDPSATTGGLVEVLNFGKASQGTSAEYLVYLHKARHFSLDVVVLAFFVGNDVRDNSRALHRIYRNNDTGSRVLAFFDKNSATNTYDLHLPPPTVLTFRHHLKDHLALYRFWRFVRDNRIPGNVETDGVAAQNDVISDQGDAFSDRRLSPMQAELPFVGQQVGYGVYLPADTKEWKEAW